MCSSEEPWYTSMVVAFLSDDCPRLLGISRQLFDADVNTLRRRLAAEGEGFLTKTLPALGKSIDFALQQRSPLVTSLFKKRGRTALPAFGSALLRRIFDDDGWVRTNPCIMSIRLVRQLCFWCKKLEKGYSDESLQQAVADYEKVDAALPSCEGDLAPAGRLLAVARACVEWVLRDIGDPTRYNPAHGPGAVASGDGVVWKRDLGGTRYRDLEAVFRPIPWFFSLRDAAECPQRITRRDEQQAGISRLAFVNKDSSGPRGINLEPAQYAWAQQAIKELLYEHLQMLSPAKGLINFDDQTLNREFARLWEQIDTLDLSKASDRNSLALFHALFRRTRVYAWLLASRTPRTLLPDGRTMLQKKFAPMGSAVCFPVMALTIWSLTVAALHLSGMPFLLAYRKVYIYGDDLIVPHGYFTVIDQALKSVGLLLNADKCCIAGKFRESCGLDAYDGQDVTPVRFRKSDMDDRVDYVRLVEHSQSLAQATYWSSSIALRKASLATYEDLRDLGIPRSPLRNLPFLAWPSMDGTSTVRHLKRACRSGLEVKGWVFCPEMQDSSDELEMYHLRESLTRIGPVGQTVSDSSPYKGKVGPPVRGHSIRRAFSAKYRGSLQKRRFSLLTASLTTPISPCTKVQDDWEEVCRLQRPLRTVLNARK